MKDFANWQQLEQLLVGLNWSCWPPHCLIASDNHSLLFQLKGLFCSFYYCIQHTCRKTDVRNHLTVNTLIWIHSGMPTWIMYPCLIISSRWRRIIYWIQVIEAIRWIAVERTASIMSAILKSFSVKRQYKNTNLQASNIKWWKKASKSSENVGQLLATKMKLTILKKAQKETQLKPGKRFIE